MRWRWLACLLGLALPVAAATPELALRAEHPVAGIPEGNLSGLARCDGVWWAVSDRDDDRLYRLDSGELVWRAVPETFAAPAPPDTGLPAHLRAAARARGALLDGLLDPEGLDCDARGNRYVVSESFAAVLVVDPAGAVRWLPLPPGVVAGARSRGLLRQVNALFEGIAVDEGGTTLWLAAERQGRGLVRVDLAGGDCAEGCVLVAEDEAIRPPAALGSDPLPADFSALALFGGKLFTLERLAHQLCRRDAESGAVERCWSYAATALVDQRRYDSRYGLAEALWLDAQGAFIGLDNNRQARLDGEDRPVIWHFAAPAGGWLDSANTSEPNHGGQPPAVPTETP